MARLFFPKDSNDSKRLSMAVKRGKLYRVRRGIYTDATEEEIPLLLESKWYEIVAKLWPNSVAAFRTAYELSPFEGHVFIICKVRKRTQIVINQRLSINLFPGNRALLVEQFVPDLARSSLPRQLLENLSASRRSAQVRKALGRSA